MTSKEFLKSKLFDLSAEYSATTIKYYFDTFDNDHFICIHPKEDLDEIIAKVAMDIDREFIKSFPNESLSFISLDEHLSFDELVFEYLPTSILEIKTINVLKTKNSSKSHYSEKISYNQPLFRVRKISKEEILIEKEDDEFAFAA
ncbi:MAG TPA: hypothetical protein DD740_00340 [Chryseobacterium sp.]|nr:hypothetical protein [Chryseobacterium sp.]